ncbi:MAG: SprB repeat-containing protein [Bacteroidetes bacterium]|nr:SprB repeat-containing protein [Bacteroidota bacterium]
MSNIFTGLAAGAYTVTIKDANNCINTSSVINVNSNSGATVTAISNNATCGASNGSITATGIGGTTPYQYSLDGITYQVSNILQDWQLGAYTVTIKDANNCINTSSCCQYCEYKWSNCNGCQQQCNMEQVMEVSPQQD